ncbi:MAG: osmotically inducible protein OsmC [Anaerolinea sp.]|nr:osmotically inducible protein OsmC [Anaerolinea sp.]
MAYATVKRISGKQFLGIDSTNHSVVLSTPAEGVGVKPSEMLLVALGSCTAVDVVEILEKKKIDLTFLEILVSAEQDKEPPWAFRKIHLLYKLRGNGLTPKAAEQAIELSETKYCSVAATIRGVTEITTSFEILPDQS